MKFRLTTLLLLLVISIVARGTPVAFDLQDPQHSKVVFNSDGTIKEIHMPDGRILLGGQGTICAEDCIAPPLMITQDNDRKWLVPLIFIATGVGICAALCRGNDVPTVVPNNPTVPGNPIAPLPPPFSRPPDPTSPVPEPATVILLSTGLLGFLVNRRRI